MKIKDYQYMTSVETGVTFEDSMIKYFNINTNQTIENVMKDLEEKTKITPLEKIPRRIWFNKKLWTLRVPFLDESYDQWSRLESLLAEEDNIKNLHKLIAIYFRPNKFCFFKTKFNMKTQDKVEDELLDLDMNIAQTLMVFFSHRGTRYLHNMNISYLNQMKQTSVQSTKNK